MADKITELYDKWSATRDNEVRGELLRALEPTVTASIRSYGGGDDSLKTRARIMTSDAINSYDPKRNTKLTTHVHSQLKGLYRIRGDRQNVIYVPENTRLDHTHIKAFMNEWKDKNGYEPDMLTIAEGMKVSKKRVRNALGFGTMPTSMASSDKGDVNTAVVERSPKDVWTDYVYFDQDPVGRKIMEWGWGYNDVKKLPVNEIARRLKMSPSAVSQRRGSILKKIQEAETS